MISFYPGPSRVHDKIPAYVKDAYEAGILSINHRSEEFIDISRKTTALLKRKLHIPDEYSIYFTGSATECWEIIAQSLMTRRSHHLFNGSFGEKWFEYTRRITNSARSHAFEPEELVNPQKLKVGENRSVICITQNETSNGTQVSNETIAKIRENYAQHLIAVDATSSMGGIRLDFEKADIWFASVQKCFGLPAGLGLMVVSPAAIDEARTVNERKHYNSLVFMDEMMQKWQTTFTPNVLGIYLLMRVMDDSKDIDVITTKTEKRYRQWMKFLHDRTHIHHLIRNTEAHSYTVLPIEAEEDFISEIKSKARRKKILLGEGYGPLKTSTFRIANFPAIRKHEIETLKDFLSRY